MKKDDGRSKEELLREIEELREQIPSLRRAEEELDAAIHSIADGVMIFGPDRCLKRINTVALHLIQYSPAIGKATAEEISKQCLMRNEAGLEISLEEMPVLRAFEGETIINEPVFIVSVQDRYTRCISLSAAPMRSRDGNPMGVVATFRDVTRQRNLQKQREELLKKVEAYAGDLERANQTLEMRVEERTRELSKAHADLKAHAAKLEKINKELQDFAFIASHDLQEPLRKIQTFGDRLKTKCADCLKIEGLDYLTRMLASAKRMQTLLQGLLSYSRVATQASPFESTDLTILAHHALSDLYVAVEEAKARITIEQLPIVAVDRDQMRQVFQNLISNAVKYRDAARPPEVRIHGEVDGDCCRLFVEDNGIGFEEKYLDRIFKPFQRLHGRSAYEGTGIGLAICRKIVERHGGTISAKSTPGKGSTFIVTISLGK